MKKVFETNPQTAAKQPRRRKPAGFENGSGADARQRRVQLRQDALLWLAGRRDQMAVLDAFHQKFGVNGETSAVLAGDDFVVFDFQGQRWIQPRKYHDLYFRDQMARSKKKTKAERAEAEQAWRECIPLCGEVMRPDGTRGKSGRLYVTARSYTLESAAKRLGFATGVLRAATATGDLSSFTDPDGKTRIPAAEIEGALNDPAALETIEGNTRVKVREISIVSGLSFTNIRHRLRKARLSQADPLWKHVRGLWGLPDSLKEFNAVLEVQYPLWLESMMEIGAETGVMPPDVVHQARARARAEASRLREQLIAVFPTWDRDRTEQHITLHLGPTNSGKTFSGLNNLAAAGSGWYLSPLRLLAHEVYETMNQRGVPCNLLTGEERIDVPGAQITAATIEMFNPRRCGECIIVDEAHMLADEQRGWAWTRAVMEASAPEIHIAGSPVSEALIYRLARELGFEVTTERYERLTPLVVAARPWSLENLPPRTILVAFSRKTVLGLKAELEKHYDRTVAVVYGNLPPEVRLRQAERFASGEAEICVATDAIGMGLNLPADNVCFYEVEKFDGKDLRVLTPNEFKQIAGRAGRYGLSEQGMVGALSKANLSILRGAIEAENTDIGFAYVAPAPESLALLTGRLDEKLGQWVTLKAIPDRWRRLLKPVDLSEQITLAGMLSPDDVRRLGEQTAMQLISAPCANNTEPYWLTCARAIIRRRPMPAPDGDLPRKITDTESLESYELMIRCADIYLWLAQRREFAAYGPQEERVRAERRRLSQILDEALAARIDTTRRCRTCGRPLPLKSRYNICERCFHERPYTGNRRSRHW